LEDKQDIDTQRALNLLGGTSPRPGLSLLAGETVNHQQQNIFSPAAFYALTTFLLQQDTRWFSKAWWKLDA
jgi:hypothetical protein